jgi:hypothetical protein
MKSPPSKPATPSEAPPPMSHKEWSQRVAQEFTDNLNKRTAEARARLHPDAPEQPADLAKYRKERADQIAQAFVDNLNKRTAADRLRLYGPPSEPDAGIK